MDKKASSAEYLGTKGFRLNRQLRRAQTVKHLLRDSHFKLILDIGCTESFITGFLMEDLISVCRHYLDKNIH